MITLNDLEITRDKNEAMAYLITNNLNLPMDLILPIYRRFKRNEIDKEMLEEITYNLRNAYENE